MHFFFFISDLWLLGYKINVFQLVSRSQLHTAYTAGILLQLWNIFHGETQGHAAGTLQAKIDLGSHDPDG